MLKENGEIEELFKLFSTINAKLRYLNSIMFKCTDSTYVLILSLSAFIVGETLASYF